MENELSKKPNMGLLKLNPQNQNPQSRGKWNAPNSGNGGFKNSAAKTNNSQRRMPVRR